MLLIYKISRVLVIKQNKSIDFENNFEYHVLRLAYTRKTYFANKFMSKTNFFLNYTKVMENVINKNKYQRIVKTQEDKQATRTRIDGNNFILLGNHGYNKKYDLFFGFDYYVPHDIRSSIKKAIFYFQFIAIGKKSELVFSIYDLSSVEKFYLILEPNSHFSDFLLHNINNQNDNFVNIKNYFNNYKKMLKNFILDHKKDSNSVMYLYRPKFEKLDSEYSSYQQMICRSSERNKKANLNYHMHYDGEFTILDTLHPRYYSIITKHRLLTSFITVNGLEYEVELKSGTKFVTPPNNFYNSYILYKWVDRVIILFDDADYFRKIFESYYNEKVKEQKLIHSELIKNLIRNNTQVNILISLNKDTNLNIEEKSEYDNNSEWLRLVTFISYRGRTYIVKGSYKLYLFYFRALDITFYENERSIYMKFDVLFLYCNIDGNNKDSGIVELYKELVQIYLANNYHVLKIDANFLPFLLSRNALEKFVSTYRDLVRVKVDKRLIFGGPFILIINIDELEIKAKDLPSLCNSIAEVTIGGDTFYVFNLRIASDFAYITSTVYMNDLRVEYNEHKGNKTKKIKLKFHQDNKREFDELYLKQILSLINKGYIRILVSFYVSKTAWDSLKCDNAPISEIKGKFYMNYDRPGSASFLDIICAPIYLQDGYYHVLVS